MSILQAEQNFLKYLSTLKDSAAYVKAVDAWNASKAYLSKFGDGVEPLGDAHDTSGLKKRSVPKKSLADTTFREAGQKIASGAKQAAAKIPEYTKNGLSKLSNLKPGMLGGAAVFAAPAIMAQYKYENGGWQDANPMIPLDNGQVYDEETGQTFDTPIAKVPGSITPVDTSNAEVAKTSMEEAMLNNPEINKVTPQKTIQADLDYLNSMGVVADDNAKLVPNALDALSGISDADLAKAVIAGKYGNGADRRAALGDRYAAVQSLVNKQMAQSAPTANATPVVTPRRADRMIRPMTIGEANARGMGNFAVLPDGPNKYIQ